MAKIPYSLTDEGLEETMALGREMFAFIIRRGEIKALDPSAKIEPHPELLALIEGMKARAQRQDDRPK